MEGKKTLHVTALHFTHPTPLLTLVTYWLHTFLSHMVNFLQLVWAVSRAFHGKHTSDYVSWQWQQHPSSGWRQSAGLELTDLICPQWISTICVFVPCLGVLYKIVLISKSVYGCILNQDLLLCTFITTLHIHSYERKHKARCRYLEECNLYVIPTEYFIVQHVKKMAAVQWLHLCFYSYPGYFL